MNRLYDIVIIGAGPAGMMAAIHAARTGVSVCLAEKGHLSGRKLLLTGGRRCNVTHAGSVHDLLYAYGPYKRFLRHALHILDPKTLCNWFGQLDVSTTIDSEGNVFPVSQRAEDIRNALMDQVRKYNVHVQYDCPIQSIACDGSVWKASSDTEILTCRALILATGGLSYPQTGSTGDGYTWAECLGHTIVPPRPALAPLVTQETWPTQLSGASVEDVLFKVTIRDKPMRQRGPLLFTRHGIGGPVVLNLSRLIVHAQPEQIDLPLSLDLVPRLNMAQLEDAILKKASERPKQSLTSLVAHFVPKRLAQILSDQTGCSPDLWACNMTRHTRRKLLSNLKGITIRATGTGSIDTATITCGGIGLDDVDPLTMQSRRCPGLFLAGEILDCDGPCGGYNLQIAWSTGALSGKRAAEYALGNVKCET